MGHWRLVTFAGVGNPEGLPARPGSSTGRPQPPPDRMLLFRERNVMPDRLYELRLPLFVPMVSSAYIATGAADDVAIVATETREQAEEIIGRVCRDGGQTVAYLVILNSNEELLTELRHMNLTFPAHQARYLGLRLQAGGVGRILIRTLIAQLEQPRSGPGPSASVN